MILKLFAQFVLASLMLQVFPVDARDLEANALQTDAQKSASTYTVFTIPQPHLPMAPDVPQPPKKKDPRRLGVVTSAVSAIVIDHASGAVLFEKNKETPRSIGSITKLMTAYVFLQGHPDLEEPAALESEDVRLGGIQHLRVGEQVRVRDLLYAALISSDNSAAAALVRLSRLSLGDFVAKMNETAAAIGMTHTQFVDSTGLSANNTSVVEDIARLLDAVSREPAITDATTHDTFSLVTAERKTYVLQSTDDLLGSFMNQSPYRIIVAKTGYLPEAGYCLGTLFSRNGKNEILVVVLGSDSDAGRFQDVKALAAWTYDAWEWL